MAINVKNIATGEILSVKNTGIFDGKLFVFAKSLPERWVKKYPMFKLTGEILAQGSYNKYELLFVEGVGYELASIERKPRTQKTAMEAVDVQPVTGEINPEVEIRELGGEPVEVIKVEEVTKEEKKVETPSLDAATQAFAALTPLFAGVQANVTAAVMNEIKPLISKVEAVCGRAPQIIKHVIKTDKGEVTSETGEVFHANFDDVCNRIARGSWVYLFGPTGSGKNVMAEQIARALGLNFHYQAHTLDRFELTGFIDANGNYQPTEFYKAYTEGGLFMLDELDGSDENALITLNSASNGYFAFPCGTVKAHPNFRCIAAGNTCGRGGTDDYTARRVMDISSLGRFIPRFHNYCNEIDMAAANSNAELVDFVHTLRRIKKETGCQIIASPRQIKEIVKDEEQGMNLTQTLSDMFGTYLTADELNIVKESLRSDESMTGNKYAKAFKKVQAIEY